MNWQQWRMGEWYNDLDKTKEHAEEDRNMLRPSPSHATVSCGFKEHVEENWDNEYDFPIHYIVRKSN